MLANFLFGMTSRAHPVVATAYDVNEEAPTSGLNFRMRAGQWGDELCRNCKDM